MAEKSKSNGSKFGRRVEVDSQGGAGEPHPPPAPAGPIIERRMRRGRVVTIYRCRLCQRRLTDTESKKIGYGPTCIGRVQSVVFKQLEDAGQMRLPGI